MTCAVPDCRRDASHRGWCMRHYRRWHRHGDPTAGGPYQPKSYVRLDPTPLLEALDLAVASRVSDMTPADSRAFYRARRRGWIGDVIADRLACRYLGVPLPAVYGTDYDQEAA